MGKYKYTIQEFLGEPTTSKLELLCAIANELAEANKLKRLELLFEYGDDYYKRTGILLKIEDEA